MTQTWDEFTSDLSAALAALGEYSVLVLASRAERANIVQFVRDEDKDLLADVPGNAHRPGHLAFTPGDEALLRSLGWHMPARLFARRTQRNWSLGTPGDPGPEDFRALASAAVETLRQVHGVAAPELVEYEAHHSHTGAPIELASLHIPRSVPRAADTGQ
ncbi:TY-Chap domain-containing protein [Longispora albida]|uniref:TY-Chap domain-containing protein n=1 Tax=Longispora albida TaxID=203523 RepID=UPI00037D1398|nr:hypothetical protein [Longispora albida]